MHIQDAGVEDVDLVYFLRGDHAHCPGHGVVHNLLAQCIPTAVAHLLRVVEVGIVIVGRQYHRSGIDTAGKTATASLVAAGLDAVFIIMWEEWMAFVHRIICSCYRLQNYKKKVIIVLILIIF